jgi:hypothetical protein
VAPQPTADPRLQAAEVEVTLVVDNEDGVGVDLVELGGGADRAARLVHVGLGLEKRDLVAVDPHLGQLPVELRAP